MLLVQYCSTTFIGGVIKDEDSTANVVQYLMFVGMEFYARKMHPLFTYAKTMYELVKDHNKNEDENTVPINSLEGCLFEIVLEFVYCVRTPEITHKDTAIKLLLIADRLGCTDLKIYVESTIVEFYSDASNATEWVVRSDSHSCPLLTEASMQIYASDNSSVLESEGWSQVEESHRLGIRHYSSSVRANHL